MADMWYYGRKRKSRGAHEDPLLPSSVHSYLEPVDFTKGNLIKIMSDQGALASNGALDPENSKIYKVIKDGLIIYRVWNHSNPQSEYGNWWTFEYPEDGTYVQTYRKENGICSEWSPLDMLSSAEIKRASFIIVGSGASVECNEFVKYSTDIVTSTQVYIDSPTKKLQHVKTIGRDGFLWLDPSRPLK